MDKPVDGIDGMVYFDVYILRTRAKKKLSKETLRKKSQKKVVKLEKWSLAATSGAETASKPAM